MKYLEKYRKFYDIIAFFFNKSLIYEYKFEEHNVIK